MRTHLPVALMIAICAVTAVAATRMEVTQGVKKFDAGDSITIAEVSSEKGTLAAGDTITVKGTYILASQKKACLLLSVTQDTTKAPPSEQQDKGVTRKTINAGAGEYEMTISIPREGWLHLGFYNSETGKPFGQLYFGTKEQMDKIAHWNLDYVTSEQSGENIVCTPLIDRFRACENNAGAGFFLLDSTCAKLWRASPQTMQWEFLGQLENTKPSPVGTYVPVANKSGGGLSVVNSATGEGWWTDGKQWKSFGKLTAK